MAAILVTLAQAKAHLGITTPQGHVDDPTVQLKLDGAEAAILRYVGKSAIGVLTITDWIDDPAAVDPDAVAAILLHLGELWRFRGDDLDGPARHGDEDLAQPVIGLLRRFTDPVLS